MVGMEDVEEDLANHQEAEDNTDRRCKPIKIEEDLIEAVVAKWKRDRKGNDLKYDIGEEVRKCPIKLAPQHDGRDRRLQKRMRDPKREVREMYVRAHPVLGRY